MNLKTAVLKKIIFAVFICGFSALYFTAAAFPVPAEAIYVEETIADGNYRGDIDGAETEITAPEESKPETTPLAQIKSDSGAKRENRFFNMNTMSVYFGENDWNFVGLMTLRFVMNILFAYIIICLIYSKEHRVREYSFSFFVSNILIFLVTSLLASVKVRTGFAFGLFAILSILRYRTEQIQIREMTFLFVSIILGVINSLATAELTIFAVLWANVILCICVYLCDEVFIGRTESVILVYDNTKLLAKGNKQELHEDIKKRFGYDVVKVVIMKMNYLTDSAEVKLVFKH